MNTFNRAQGMDNQKLGQFTSEINNEMNYIKAHPFSAVSLGAGSEVRYIAPLFPWNDPKFARPPVSSIEAPKAITGCTKHSPEKKFSQPLMFEETTPNRQVKKDFSASFAASRSQRQNATSSSLGGSSSH